MRGNRSGPGVSSQQNIHPTFESRKAIFQRLSETLRPSITVSNSTLPKINQASTASKIPESSKGRSNFASSILGQRNRKNSQSARKGNLNRNGVQKYKGFGVGGGGEGPHPSAMQQGMKNCHLSNVLLSAKRCIVDLREAKEKFSELVAQDDQLSQGMRKTNPTEDHLQLAEVARNVTSLCREAFVPAHRLNQTAISLHSAEDFLRYPHDIKTFENSSGRIKLPEVTFNNSTLLKLRQVVDLAAETFNLFSAKGKNGEQLSEILYKMLKGYQDFYAAALGCQEIFKVLLYTGPKDKTHLQQFLLALSSVDRSELLVEIQDLRRILDEIVIFLEKLSWGSFVIYRLAGGEENDKNVAASETQPKDEISNKNNAAPSTSQSHSLSKAKDQKLSEKKLPMDQWNEMCNEGRLPMTKPDSSSANASISTRSSSKQKSYNSRKSKFCRKKLASTDDEISEDGPNGDSQRTSHSQNLNGKSGESNLNYSSNNANFADSNENML